MGNSCAARSAWLLADHAMGELAALRASAWGEHITSARAASPRSVGDTLEIPVEGILTKHPDPFAALFSGSNTTYASVINALARAQADASIARVVLDVDSPGGSVDGLFDALAAIESFSKPITARCAQACSAAYALAAMTSRIEATSVGASFGGIGVAASFLVLDDVVSITSTEAPEKRPDVTTPDGQASVRRYLDAVHDLFVDAIARARKTTAARVNAEFGRGAVVLARDAKRAGMIDAVATPRTTNAAAHAAEGANAMMSQTQHARDVLARFVTARAECSRSGPNLVARVAARLDARVPTPSVATADMGDLVAARMHARRGKALPAELAARLGSAPDASTRGPGDDDDEEDFVPAASRGSGDIGDIVAARMRAKRGKK